MFPYIIVVLALGDLNFLLTEMAQSAMQTNLNENEIASEMTKPRCQGNEVENDCMSVIQVARAIIECGE